MARQTATSPPRSSPAGVRRKASSPAAEGARVATPAARGDGFDPSLALEMSDAPSQLEGPTREQMIRLHAYSRYLLNGCIDGHDIDDWLAAEAEVDAMLDGSDNTNH